MEALCTRHGVGPIPSSSRPARVPGPFPAQCPAHEEAPSSGVQEPRDQGEILRQYTKLDHRMEHQDNPGLMVSRMLQVAMSEPKGPVYLAIPQETAMLPPARRHPLSLPGPAGSCPAGRRPIRPMPGGWQSGWSRPITRPS